VAAAAATDTGTLPALTAPGGWQARVLQALGAAWDPSTPAGRRNVSFLDAWARQEGTKARYNPLATTLALSGSTVLAGNAAGVRNYVSAQQGIQATVQTIRGYPTIVQALRSGQPQQVLATPAGRAELNKWATGKPDPGYSAYVSGIARGFYDEKGAGDWTSFDLKGAASAAVSAADAAASAVGDAALAPVKWVAGWLEGVGAKALAYLVLTVLALGLIGLGLGQMFGINPLELARARAGARAAGGLQTEEIPF
jgi:hypothetical protein